MNRNLQRPWRRIAATGFQLLALLALAAFPSQAGREFTAGPGDVVTPDQILIKLKPGARLTQILAAVAPGADSSALGLPNHYVLRIPGGLPPGLTRLLAANPFVEFVEPDRVRSAIVSNPSDPYYVNSGSGQWGLFSVQALQAWNYLRLSYLTAGTADPGRLKVAVLDTGADCAHPDFMNSGGSSTNSALGGQLSWSGSQALVSTTVVSPTCAWQDDHGHGTHVAGILAAATSNGAGVSSLGFPLQLMIYKVLDKNGSGADSVIANAITAATDAGARVISMSLGGAGYSQTLQSAIDYAWQKNVVVIAAAGNSATGALYFPGGANHAVGVSATDSSGNLASFSNYGNGISVAAPGVSILSTIPRYSVTLGCCNYGYLSGTSMATPFVSALAGLVALSTPNTTAAAIVQRMEQSAASTVSGGAWDSKVGYGIIQAFNAVAGVSRSTTTGGITGQIVDANGTPVSQATVNVAGQVALTDVTGLFWVRPIAAGTYAATVSAAGYPMQSLSVTVAPGADTTFSVAMGVSYGSFVGTVTRQGAAIAGAIVQAVQSGRIVGTAVTNSSGQYTLWAPAGSGYTVQVSQIGLTTASSTGLSVSAGGSTTAHFTVASLLGQVAGTVVDGNSTPVAGMTVTISASGFTSSAVTNAGGSYVIQNVPAGTYTVTASAGGVTATASNVVVTGDNTTTANLTLSVTPTSVTIASVPSGRVLTVDGSDCTSPCSLPWIVGTTHTLSASAQAGATDVRYAFASWSDGGAASHNVTISAGGATYTANFTTQYYLRTDVSPANSGSVDPASAWFNAGTVVTLRASAESGYQFSNFSNGLTATSNPATLTVNAPTSVTANFVAGSLQFLLRGNAGEITALTNAAPILPAVKPSGLSGRLVVRGTGSAALSPVIGDDGVVFALPGQQNANTAFLSFTGSAAISTLFNLNQGDLTFYMKSSYTLAERQALTYRYAFQVDDGTQRLFFFAVTPSGSRLAFTYATGFTSSLSYFVPVGQEDAVFGKGVVAKFRLTWDGSRANLYLNDVLAASSTYTKAASNWTSAASFTVGATSVYPYNGGYFSSDDAVGGFQLAAPAGVPQVSLNPTLLSFGNQTVGAASAAQPVTLTNSGTGALTISSIAIVGSDFSQSNNCGASLAAAASCTVNVTFTPTATGARSASLTITDSAAGSPHSVALSGTGVGIPQVSLNPTSLSFGNQTVGAASAAQPVTLTNSGTGALTISSIAVVGSDFSQTNNCSASLAAAASCTVNVTFTPTATGARSASLTVTDSAAGSPHSVALSGTGVGVPQVSLNPTSLAFGNQTVGAASAAQPVTLTNSGTGTLTISTIGIVGSDFSQSNNCGASLAAAASCTVNVTFTPTATGARSASLTVTDSAAGSPHSVALSGSGVGVAQVSLNPTSLAFGNQTVGAASAAQPVTLTNSGTGTLTISTIGIVGSDFSQSNNCGASLAAAASCTVNVTFTPTATGARSASLTVTDSAAGSPHSVALSGTGVGVPQVSLNPTSLAFGNQTVGAASAAQPVTLTNSGTGALTISSIAIVGSDFSQTNNCGASLAAAASCTVNVTFTPTATGARSASLTVTDSAAGSPHSVALSGSGVGVPQVSLNPTSLSFGNQTVGAASAAQPVTLTNSGTGALTISSIAIVGSDFSQTNNCGASLAAAASCTVNVTFTPTATGARSASLTITDSAAGSPHSVALSGTGLASGSTPAFLLRGISAEIPYLTNASVVTPSNFPVGLTGSLVVRGTGAATFAPVVNGDGIAFSKTGQQSSDTAFVKFVGAPVASLFSLSQGDLTFYLKSAYSLAERVSQPYHYAFQVDDGTQRLFFFAVTPSGSRLAFSYATGITGSLSYFVPIGQEETIFGKNVVAKFRLTWDGSRANLYLNDTLVASTAYTKAVANWTSAASFTIGATSVYPYGGGYFASDDPIADFRIADTGTPAPQAPQASLSPTSVSFGNQTTGSPTAAQTVTVTNTGNAALTISSIAITGANASDFSQTNNCGVSLAASSSCAINVIFTPAAAGSRSASVSITDSAAGSPHSVALSGSGVAPSSGGPTFYLRGNNTEIPSLANGASVTPSNAPSGMTSSLVVRGTGGATFVPVVNGDGIGFSKTGQQASNTAFLKFTGTPISSLFNLSQGDLTFYLKSSYSLSERVSQPYHYAFQVDDGTQRLFFFAVTPSGSRLAFSYATGITGSLSYFVPIGQEDAVFGKNVVAKFRLTWDGSRTNLYLNDTLVASTSYTKAVANWTSAASFTIGATSVYPYGGGYFASDDPIAGFRIE